MKNFHCDQCDQPVFFENSACLKCGHALAYLPDLQDMVSLEAAREQQLKAERGVASPGEDDEPTRVKKGSRE